MLSFLISSTSGARNHCTCSRQNGFYISLWWQPKRFLLIVLLTHIQSPRPSLIPRPQVHHNPFLSPSFHGQMSSTPSSCLTLFFSHYDVFPTPLPTFCVLMRQTSPILLTKCQMTFSSFLFKKVSLFFWNVLPCFPKAHFSSKPGNH